MVEQSTVKRIFLHLNHTIIKLNLLTLVLSNSRVDYWRGVS